LMRHDQQIDVMLPVDLWQQRRERRKCIPQHGYATERAAVDEHMKRSSVRVAVGYAHIDTIAEANVEQSDQKLICHCRPPVPSSSASPPIEKCGARVKRIAPATSSKPKGGEALSSMPSSPPTVSPIMPAATRAAIVLSNSA